MQTFRPVLAALLLCHLLFVPVSLTAQTSPLQSGPMVGYSEMTEVMLWVQTAKKASVQFRVWPLDKPAEKLVTAPVTTVADDAFVARVPLSRLSPGTRYGYEVLVDGKSVKRPYRLQFQTQSLWQWRTDPPAFTAAIGSCFYINETPVDRPGTPYGSDERIVTTIVAAKPDLMLWLGDNTYYREVDWNTAEGLRYRWTHTRSLPELQPLLGSVHHYYVWDDHDFGPNDADRSYRLRTEALAVHKLFTANGTYGTLETPGVFGRFEWADVEFFLLDDRFHRAPNNSPDGPDKVMLGPGQMQWLKDALVNSRAPFKIVANGNQVLNPLCEYEALVRFPTEYDDLLAFIKANRIPGVVFISGDVHWGELSVLRPKDCYPIYDLTASGLNRDWEIVEPNRNRVGEVCPDFHFGMLDINWSGSPSITFRIHDMTGRARVRKSVKLSELKH